MDRRGYGRNWLADILDKPWRLHKKALLLWMIANSLSGGAHKHKVYVHYKKLSKLLGCTPETIKRALSLLVEQGYLGKPEKIPELGSKRQAFVIINRPKYGIIEGKHRIAEDRKTVEQQAWITHWNTEHQERYGRHYIFKTGDFDLIIRIWESLNGNRRAFMDGISTLFENAHEPDVAMLADMLIKKPRVGRPHGNKS